MPLKELLDNNRKWVERMEAEHPGFFQKLARQQKPEYLWIGCADSRVPANEIVGMLPGELFVHRNVANLVLHTDFNCLSVLEFAVEVLKVRHIIVCGHYGCGGVTAALSPHRHGLIDNWLRHIRDVYRRHADEVNALAGEQARIDRLCELNVMQQVRNVVHTTIVQAAWDRGAPLAVHGWIYSVADGLLRDLEVTVRGVDQIDPVYRTEPDTGPR